MPYTMFAIPAILYTSAYFLIITILTIFLSIKYASYSDDRLSLQFTSLPIGSLILTIGLIFFIGFRPISGLFTDMLNYVVSYNVTLGQRFLFELDLPNPIFDNLFNYFASSGYDITYFFLMMSLIYFGGIFIACNKIFPKDSLFAIVIYLAAFSTFSYAVNGIKAGAAASIFLCAIAYWRKFLPVIILLAFSYGFHHSMILPIVAFIIAYFYRNIKIYFICWVICIIISAAQISYFQEFFASISDEGGASYLINNNSGYRSGFRFDFVIYSAAPILLGLYLIYKRGYHSDTYNFIFCLYTLVNAVWILCIYASFTNRIAYLSWFMLPIMLIYPFLDYKFEDNQYKKLNWVAWGNLCFSLIMIFYVYGKPIVL